MMIMQVSPKGGALAAAEGYVNAEAGFDTAEKALAGAQDIVAEAVAEDPENVADLRAFTEATADVSSVAVDAAEKTPYEPYYDYAEPLRKVPNHRVARAPSRPTWTRPWPTATSGSWPPPLSARSVPA